MKNLIFFAFFFSFHSLQAQTNTIIATVIQRPSTKTINSYYAGNKKPLEPLSFIKLPVGSIKPGGWIKKYLELQRDGLTGKLGEISAWLEKKNNAWFSGTGKGDHGWEEVPYWLKGYGDLGYILKDKSIIDETRLWIEKVFESQRPDGFFGPGEVVRNKKNKIIKVPDLWPNMIMLWCMQSYYEYSNDTRVIPFMTKYFEWQSTVPDSILLKTYWENSRGGDNLYSIYWLYNRTGQKLLLDLANKIYRNTADWNQDNNLPNWHNVNIAQCFREPATYYMQSKDSSLESKQAVLLAIEKLSDGRTGNIRMQPIENFEAQTLKFALKDMVSPETVIKTDHHRSYQNLKKGMKIETVLSNRGQSLEELHKQIMQFKNWLRGIHHKCSAQYLFAYTDEYVFRFNRRNNRKSIFHKVVDKMMNQVPHPYPVLKTLCYYST